MILEVITANKQAAVLKNIMAMILDIITANKQAAVIKKYFYCNDS